MTDQVTDNSEPLFYLYSMISILWISTYLVGLQKHTVNELLIDYLYYILLYFLYYIIFLYYGKGFSYFARVWIMAMTIVYLGKMRIKDSYFFKFRIICMHFKDKYWTVTRSACNLAYRPCTTCTHNNRFISKAAVTQGQRSSI